MIRITKSPPSSATDQPDLSRYFKTLRDWIRVILIPADCDFQIWPRPLDHRQVTGNGANILQKKGDAGTTIVSKCRYNLGQF